MICKLSTILTDLLCKENIIPEADRPVYEYGFQITMANITNFFIVLFIGLLFRTLFKVFIFYCVFISLRIFCGGFHAKSYTRCFLLFGTTCCLCMVSSQAAEASPYLHYYAALACALQGICTYKMAPIEHANRPFTEEERVKFKRLSWLMLFIWITAAVLLSWLGKNTAVSTIFVTLISVSILMIMAYLKGGE